MIDDGLVRASYRAVATTTGRPAPRLRAGRLDGADRALTAWRSLQWWWMHTTAQQWREWPNMWSTC